jgi:hypothetical protein
MIGLLVIAAAGTYAVIVAQPAESVGETIQVPPIEAI